MLLWAVGANLCGKGDRDLSLCWWVVRMSYHLSVKYQVSVAERQGEHIVQVTGNDSNLQTTDCPRYCWREHASCTYFVAQFHVHLTKLLLCLHACQLDPLS